MSGICYRIHKLPDWVYNPDQVLDELYEFKSGDPLPSEHGTNATFGMDCWGIKRRDPKELLIICSTPFTAEYAILVQGKGKVCNVTIWNTGV